GLDGDGRLAKLDARAGEGTPLPDMDRRGFHQPDVPVKASAFVKPPIAERGVDPDQQHVWAAGIDKVGKVEAERIVAATVPSHIETIQNDHGFAIGAVELDRDAPAGVRSREIEDAAIPADAGVRISAADGVESF